jgi:beta-lactamase regulating signal transducer with metallopeptidase domain
MNDHPLWLVSFLVSTFLSFFSVACVVAMAIPLLHIKNHRVRSIMRLLPMCSLAIDVCFSKLSTGNLLNPLYCESCIQKLFLYFMPELKYYLAEHQIAWSKHLASQMPDVLLTTFLLSFSFISTIIYVRKVIQILSFNRSLYTLIEQGNPCPRKIENSGLSHALTQHKVKILISDAIQSPMAAYLRTILIPKNVAEQFPQDEFEAIIAHELEHLRWKDPILKLISQIGSTLFWWVPTRWWLKSADQDREMSADASIQRYSLDSAALASALVKVRTKCRSEPVACCAFAVTKVNSLLVRLQMICDPSAPHVETKLFLRTLTGLAAGSLIILMCRM